MFIEISFGTSSAPQEPNGHSTSKKVGKNSKKKESKMPNMIDICHFRILFVLIEFITKKQGREIDVPGHQMENNEVDRCNETFCCMFDL